MTKRFRTRIRGRCCSRGPDALARRRDHRQCRARRRTKHRGHRWIDEQAYADLVGLCQFLPGPASSQVGLSTALAEIVGCYLPYLWLKKDGSPWLLVVAGVSLALFVWLLSLHPAAAGRVYAAYGGVYVAVALLWLWHIDGVSPTAWDLAGVAVTLAGIGIIEFWGGWQV